jgi:spore maturation protein CgeB
MATVGFSPPTRVFEAAGSGACVITDNWAGIETFFTPGSEILTAASAEDVVHHLRTVDRARAREIGNAMLEHAVGEHTYERRARQSHSLLQPVAAPLEVPA